MYNLKAFRKDVGISQNDLAVLLKCGQPNISSMEKSHRDLDPIQEMILKKQYGNSTVDKYKEDVQDEEDDDSEYIPLLPIEAMAGSLQGRSDGVELRNCRKIKSPVAGADWAIQISGDSMEPDFKNGSILFIRKLTSRMIPWGHPMVIDTYDGVVFKKIFPDDEEYIEARSINPDYPPFQIERSIVLGLYRVLGSTFINSTI